jgi:cyclohexanecarboxylate-CoA ligase
MPRFETTLTPAASDRYLRSGAWPGKVLTDLLHGAVRATPNRPAIVDSRRTVTWFELNEEVDRCALALLERGIGPGDALSIQLPNWIEFAVLHLAATRIGAITSLITPINRDREVAHMLRLSESKLIVVPGDFRGYDYVAMVQRLRPEVPGLETILVVGETDAPDALGWEAFLAAGDASGRERCDLGRLRPDPDAVTEIVFTSGTTGEPKGVLHTSNTMLAPQIQMARSLALTPASVLHIASPIAHQTGFLGGIVLPVLTGCTIVYQDVWRPAAFVEMIERHRIDVSNGNATFLLDMLRAENLAQHDLSSFRIFRAGGGPIPAAIVREANEKLPHVTILRGWGQSENGVVTLTRLGDPPEKRVETDGCAQPGMEVRVVDEANVPLAPDTEGRLQCRGPFQFVGYARRPEITAASYAPGEWFDTGDLATMDAQGYIRITGRARDMVIRGGEKVPVKYVEDVLYEDERVLDVAIVGMPDPRLGERACAFVIPRAGCTLALADVQSFLESRGVSKQYWPERLELREDLPRAANGKVRKADLRTLIAQTLAAEQAQASSNRS